MILQIENSDIPYGPLRENSYALKIMAAIAIFYMAYQTAKRIKDAGIMSNATGFTLYMIGNGVFHIGGGLYFFYSQQAWSLWVFRISNYIYLSAMALYAVFAEYEQRKYTEPGKGFDYPLSVVSLVGLGVFIGLTFVYIDLVSFGFLYMVFPFLISTSRSLEPFKHLSLIKDSNPTAWFFMGLSLSGFSNFIYSIPVDLTILSMVHSILVAVGSIMMVHGWSMIPPLSELTWYENLTRIIVVQQEASLVLFSYDFREQSETGSSDVHLAGGAISGIQSLLGEILKSDQKVNEIDHGDKTIYFNHGRKVTTILFTTGKALEYHSRLSNFRVEFESRYGQTLQNWAGNVSAFTGAKSIVEEVFKKTAHHPR